MKLFGAKEKANEGGEKVVRQYVFSVYDEKARAYNLPFFFPNEEIAKRSFGDLLQRPDSLFAKHPTDFSLYAIGTFDDLSGKIVGYVEPVLVERGRANS